MIRRCIRQQRWRFDIDLVRVLLEAGAAVNARNQAGNTPLHLAVMQRHDEEMVRALLEAGANANARNRNDEMPLHEATLHGDIDLVHLLLEAGAAVNARDGAGNTALHYALSFGNRILHMLRAKGINTPLHLVGNGPAELVRALLEAGADPTLRNNEGNTPVDLAGSDVVKRLLQDEASQE